MFEVASSEDLRWERFEISDRIYSSIVLTAVESHEKPYAGMNDRRRFESRKATMLSGGHEEVVMG